MSASGFTPIQLFRTTTAAAVPTAGSLAAGELAINLTDEALYFKNAAGVVTLLADSSGALGSVTSVAASGGTTGLTFSGSPITTSGTLTLGGTLAVANGGTGVTTSTGTGSVVLNTSPTLVTPALGVASADSLATLKGTVGSVAYGFIGNTNTGMWSPSSDAIAFSTAGAERVRVTSAGAVGIGVTNPSNALEVAGSALLRVPSGNAGYGWLSGTTNYSLYLNAADNSLRLFSSVGTAGDKLVVDANGNVGIGTTAPSARLTLQQSAASPTALNMRNRNSTQQWALAVDAATVDDRLLAFIDQTNNAVRMGIDSSGNVGIGTSSPGQRLTVVSSTASLAQFTGPQFAQIRHSDGTRTMFTQVFDNEARLFSETSTPLVFGTNNTERMRITSTGDVGIGTSSPGARMVVAAANTAVASRGTAYLYSTNAMGANLGGQLSFGGSFTGTSETVFGSIAGRKETGTDSDISGYLQFSTTNASLGNVERMRIDSSGNLLVGTGGPFYGTSGRGLIELNGSSSALFALKVGDNSFGYFGTNGSATEIIVPAAIPLVFGTNNTERMRITAAGGLAVGTTTDPGAGNIGLAAGGRLQFSSSAYITPENNVSGAEISTPGAITFRTGSGTPERARIDASGNLLVGTTTADNKLTVSASSSGAAAGVLSLVNPNDATNTASDLDFVTHSSGTLATGRIRGLVGGADNYPMSFWTYGGGGLSERARIDSSGNVGIGTSSPGARLHVGGPENGLQARFSSLANRGLAISTFVSGGVTDNGIIYNAGLQADAQHVWQCGTTERMRIDSSGRLGIGTTSPATNVDVNTTTDAVAVTVRATSSTAAVGQFGIGLFNVSVPALRGTTTNGLDVGTDSAGRVAFLTNNTERARIDSSGNLLVGTTSAAGAEGATFYGDGRFFFDANTTGSSIIKNSTTTAGASAMDMWRAITSGDPIFTYFGTEASFTTRGSISFNRGGGVVAYNTTSDYRSKDILGPVADPGATIDALKVYTGKMKGATIARPMLVAHEAQEVVPYAVTGEKDAVNEDGTDKYQQMDHQVLIPLLIAELQSLRARVAQLEGN